MRVAYEHLLLAGVLTLLAFFVTDRVFAQSTASIEGQVVDLFNHANFGRPGNMVGTREFRRIVNTRFPTGESGSSRQIQFAVKLSY